MDKINLTDPISEFEIVGKDGTVTNIPVFKEDLSTPLNTQTALLGNLEKTINMFPDMPADEWQPNPTWWDIQTILDNDTRDYVGKAIILLYSNDMVEDEFIADYIYDADAIATSDGAFYEFNGATSVTHNWDLTKDKPCIVDGVEQYKTRYIIAYSSDGQASYREKVFGPRTDAFYIITNGKFTSQNTTNVGNYSSNLSLVAIKDESMYPYLSQLFFGCYALQSIQGVPKTSISTSLYSIFQDCYNLQDIPQLDVSKFTLFNNMFYNCYHLKTIPQLDTSNGKEFSNMFRGCMMLKIIPQLDTSSGTSFSGMFRDCRALQTVPQLDTSSGTNFSDMFNSCMTLKTIPQLNTSSGTNFSSMFNTCTSLQIIPQLNTSNGTNFGSMFNACSSLKTIPQLDTSSGTNFSYMFGACSSLKTISQLDTGNGTNFGSMFQGCSKLKTIPQLNLIKATSVTSMLSSCSALENLTLKNIKISLAIGSGTSYGHLLTIDSLLNTIKELWDNTRGTSALTLTMGSTNLTKLANVYVKLVDITDDMRAEDEYIDNKKPFVVCESTDEGAMLITEYVTSKNWQLK